MFKSNGIITILKNIIVPILLLAFFNGCVSSSVRYARPSLQKKSYYVSADWDYRKHYKIPRDRLNVVVKKYLGVPYKWGGTSARGFDCSGFVKTVYADVSHAKLPRTSRAMSRLGHPVIRSKAIPGDLVFFRGGFLNRINHVGIYMGQGRFVHASSSKGVRYSSLDSKYYRKRFAGIRRIF